MADAKSRARVGRMVAGDFRPDDLTHLFLYARDHCDGRESVREIGDFVAHHNERTKGIVTQSTRDWFAIAHYAAWRFGGATPSRNVDGRNLPPILPQYLSATFRRLDYKTLRKRCGLSSSKGAKILKEAIEKLEKGVTGNYSLSQSHNETELSLVNLLCSILIVKCAFTGDRLYEDFIATLRSNGLIKESEIKAAPHLKSAIQLYAIAIMHNCAVVMTDGSNVVLSAGPFDNKISILATITPSEPPPWAAAIYEANLDATQYCEPELVAMPQWNVEIELKPDGRLGRL